MRETKYRCWDGNNGLMWEVTDLQWAKKGGLIYIRGYFINKDGKKEGIGGFKNQMTTERWNNLKLLEFIGAKIGGVDAYEGDIIKYREYNMVIEFKDGCFGFKHCDEENCNIFVTKHSIYYDDVKLIGNKFENPELLK